MSNTYRALAQSILADAKAHADAGRHFGGRVPLALVVDMTDAEARAQLVELVRQGLLSLHRADLMWAWQEAFDADTMARSELVDQTSTWHAVAVPGVR